MREPLDVMGICPVGGMSWRINAGAPCAVAVLTTFATAPNPWVYTRWAFCQVFPFGMPFWLTSRAESIVIRSCPLSWYRSTSTSWNS
jgi:hypothetical protein